MASDQIENTKNPLTDLLQPIVQTSPEAISGMPASPTHSVKVSIMRSSNGSVQTSATGSYERQEREAEEIIKHLIENLCQDLWPGPTSFKHRLLTGRVATCLRANRLFRSFVPAPQIPLVQHLEGGGFNYITSITLPSSYPEGHRNLILRVSREDDSRPDQQVAILNYVRQRTSIPVATIEATDFTCDNALGKPYVLQHRIPGKDLASVWDDLSHSLRCVVAREVGHLTKTLLSVESPIAGTIEAATHDSYSSAEWPNIVRFNLTDSQGVAIDELDSHSTLQAETSRQPESTLEFFEYYLARWRNAALAESGGEIDCVVELYDELLNVMREMDSLGLFKPDLNCLCHLDLYPRNIMVEIHSEGSIQITGILDWDEAVVAPKFVNCEPPGWLWGYDKETHTENGLLPWPYELEGANNKPSTLQEQELKSIFEECAGTEYLRLAYDESSRLIRGLYRVTTLGLTASWHHAAAERIVRDWNILRPTLAHKDSRI